jgi:hypothetical protein
MIKQLLFPLLLLASFHTLPASEAIEEKIAALVEEKSLKTHRKLLDVLFQYEDEFVDESGNADVIKIVKVLKENGLLRIFYKEPTRIRAKFISDMYPLFMMKALSDSLNKLGYHYLLTNQLTRDANRTEWTIVYNSEHAIDPLMLSEELEKYNIGIDNIVNRKNDWEYLLKTDKPVLLETHKLVSDDNATTYNDPRGEYWFHVDENASKAIIKSRYPDLWHPYIICYNANLNILKIYKRDRSTRSLKLTLPQSTTYLKLTDMFTSDNLKHGIEIHIEGAH